MDSAAAKSLTWYFLYLHVSRHIHFATQTTALDELGNIHNVVFVREWCAAIAHSFGNIFYLAAWKVVTRSIDQKFDSALLNSCTPSNIKKILSVLLVQSPYCRLVYCPLCTTITRQMTGFDLRRILWSSMSSRSASSTWNRRLNAAPCCTPTPGLGSRR